MSTTMKDALNQAFKAEFDKAEVKERAVLTKMFKAKGITNYKLSEIGSKERYDFKFVLDGKTFFGDIKNRNIKSTAYSEALIDKSKTDYLISTGKDNGWVPMIISTYTDNVALVWYLNDIKMKEEVKYCNRTTAIDTGKKDKQVSLLLTADANKVQLIND